MSERRHEIAFTVNGRRVEAVVPARMTLADLLRDRLRLTGTHVACGQGLCGSCNVLLGGRSARSCLTLAVQADGQEVTTIEGLGGDDGPSEVQAAFVRHRALQCGFCTPGFVVLAEELLAEVDAGLRPAPEQVRDRLAASVCRCTGYAPIVAAVQELVDERVARGTR
jgi:aerobic-type carbon monoxide dehydrogenase small subunit (CoxS/CutS family)